MRSLTLVPPPYHRAGDINARVCSGNDPYQERKCKIVYSTTSENIKGQSRKEYCARSDDGSAQRLVQRLVHQLSKRTTDPQFQILTNPIENHYRVVGGETNNG